LIWPETLHRSRQSSLRVPACKTIKRLPLPEGIFGASDPSFDVVFLAKSKDGDHHQEMNSVVFLEWFENQLMAALKINLFHQ
jgi:hypothetical protein